MSLIEKCVRLLLRVAKWLVGVPAAIVIYFYDDAFFAWPMVGLSALLGPLWAFCILFPVYAGAEFAISLAFFRYRNRVEDDPGYQPGHFVALLQKTAEAEASNKRTDRMKAWLFKTGPLQWLMFVVLCFTIGGIAPVVVLRLSGRREGMVQIAALSAVIFGFTFVGFYTGVTSGVLSLFH